MHASLIAVRESQGNGKPRREILAENLSLELSRCYYAITICGPVTDFVTLEWKSDLTSLLWRQGRYMNFLFCRTRRMEFNYEVPVTPFGMILKEIYLSAETGEYLVDVFIL